MEGKKPAALKFYDNIQPLKLYDNIRAEVMETAEQLKTLKTTAMKVKEISGKVKDCIGPAMSVIEMVANSSMLTDMMKKRPSGKDSAVEGPSEDNAFEGNTSEWGQKNYQGETSSMQSQPRPRGRGMSLQESSGQMQYGSPSYGQSPGKYSGARGANSLPQSREMAPTRFPGSAQNNTQPPNQQPGGPYSQGFMPRGFQQQMSSMPQPPSPQSMQGFPGPGSTTPAMGMNFSGRSPGTMMPQQGGSMPPAQGQVQPMQGRMPQPGVPMQPTQGSMPQPGGPLQPMQGRMMPQPGGPMQGRMPQQGGPMQLRMPIGQQGPMPPMQRGQQPTWSQMAPMQYPRPQ